MNLRRLRALATGCTDNELNPDHVALGHNDFRRTRTFLAPHVFATGGDLPDPPPTELIDRERWEHITHLADDVALRSSSYSGASTARMSELAYAWLRALPDNPNHAPFMHEVALGAFEEFEATTFIALHGFYRQALGSLRNAVELMTHAAALAVEQDHARFTDWRAASIELRFQQSRATLAGHATALERTVQPASVFADQPMAWARRLYKRLCGYAHSQAGQDNTAFWESNGPVYRPEAHRQTEQELREVVAYCCVCMKLGWHDFQLLPELRDPLAQPNVGWADVAAGSLAFIDV
jgi:hypothetical protein